MKKFLPLLLLLCTNVYSQFKEPKFGKIEMSEMTMQQYDKDTTAAAVILFDIGDAYFKLNNSNGFQITLDRHLRVKIFKKSAFDEGEFSIRLWGKGADKEMLTNLNAVTYNVVDGKIVKTKLNTDLIYKEESKFFTTKKFAFPDIKEGSVIELSYTLTSSYMYHFPGWTFQRDIPMIWSEYRYSIPEYFNYRESSKGYLNFTVNERKSGAQTFSILYQGTYENISTSTKEAKLAIADVPAFKSEANINCEENYIQSVDFELSSIQYPYSLRKDFTQTWESVNKEVLESEDLGMTLNSKGFIKDTTNLICAGKTNDLEKATAIYDYVQKTMRWNQNHSMWASNGLKKPYLDKMGNSAEINLLLTLMMQTAGLGANAVMISTRDNGIAQPYYPTITKYNSIISKVTINNTTYLLDATSDFTPFGVLPAKDINGRGRVINEKGGDWVELVSNEKFKEIRTYNLALNKEGTMSGQITGISNGYAGVNYRNNLSDAKSNEDFIKKVEENHTGMSIKSYSISNKYNNYKPLVDTFTVDIDQNVDVIGDKLMFSPLLYEKMDKNPYTIENRLYPIDYNYLVSENLIFNYTIPEGYEVESVPQSFSMKMPDNSLSVSYTIQVVDKTIKIAYKRGVNKIMFLPEEYADVKEFYNQIVKKHAEQIILKKTI